MAPRTQFVTVGRILKAHGVRGEAKVEPLTFDPERFRSLEHVIAVSPKGERRELSVSGSRPMQGAWLLTFREFDAPEPLAELAGWTLEVPREEAAVPPSGQTLFADMIGLTAIDAASGETIGTIRAIVTAGNDLLEISTARGDILVPWVAEFVDAIDTEGGTVKIHAIPGLLEP